MFGIVILNYKHFDDTCWCVEQLLQQVLPCDMIYVIDNDSQDLSYEKFVEKYADQTQIKVLQSGKNGGNFFLKKVGVRASIEDGLVFFLCSKNDVEICSDFFVAL